MDTNTSGIKPQRSIYRRFRALQFNSSRRLLFSWIRPNVLGCDAQGLSLEPEDYVCYVLPFRSLADLLVVDHACEASGLPRPVLPMADGLEQRSFFFLGLLLHFPTPFPSALLHTYKLRGKRSGRGKGKGR